MLFYLVMGYWLLSVAIGIMTVKKVHNSRDYAIAGRHLPFYMVTATVFATWFLVYIGREQTNMVLIQQ